MVKFSKTVVADRNGEHMERKIKQSENARLPMLELVVSIGVFAVISVFLLEMFLAANSLQQKAKDEGKAITKTETIAEMLKSADSLEEVVHDLSMHPMWGEVKEQKDGSYQIKNLTKEQGDGLTQIYSLHYDKDWNLVEKEDMYSILVIPYQMAVQGETMENYAIYTYRLQDYPSIFSQEDTVNIYQLECGVYREGSHIDQAEN